jgi:hypothetical protein
MGNKQKKGNIPDASQRALGVEAEVQNASLPDDVIPSTKVAELAVDLWKITARAKKDSSGVRVLAACERAEERLLSFGFELASPDGQAYDTNMCMRVVDHEEGDGPLIVAQCLSPAVYYRGKLIRAAEVVTRGG